MSLFFITFFSVYGAVHVYAFVRARHALASGWGPGTALAVFMLMMTLSPFFIRVLERNDYESPAIILSYVAYLWMAAIFLYFCGSLALDGVNVALGFAGWIGKHSWSAFLLAPKTSFLIAAGVALAISIHGYWSALNVRVERLRVETAKLPADIEHLKIVQVSDVHLGLIVRTDRLKRVLDLVNAEHPDIFVSTGDLVDAQIDHMQGMAELLRGVQAPYGKYAITGNHEYYAGIEDALNFTRNAGFTLLRGNAVTGVINIAGVDDPAGVQLNVDKPEPEAELLSALPRDRFTLLLKHRPSVNERASHLFDLQLSGHTHKGQIYPFTYISKMAYPMNAGRFDLAGGAILRVSRGTGTWGPPVRFLSPPEVSVIELVRKQR